MSQYSTPDNLVELQDNFREIQQKVDAVCQRIGRNPAEVRLLPVTKTLPELSTAIASGLSFLFMLPLYVAAHN